MKFQPIPKDTPLREQLQVQLDYFRKEMEIPVPIKLFYGNVEEVQRQVLFEGESEGYLYLVSDGGSVGVSVEAGAPSIFPPDKPYIFMVEDPEMKKFDSMLLHHETGHIKDYRYSDKDNFMALVLDEKTSELAKTWGFKAFNANEAMEGGSVPLVAYYYNKIVDWFADTRPTLKFIEKLRDERYETEVYGITSAARAWKARQDCPKPLIDLEARKQILYLGKGIAYGVKRDIRRRAKMELKKYKHEIDELVDFFKELKRPTSATILKRELKGMNDIAGLTEPMKELKELGMDQRSLF